MNIKEVFEKCNDGDYVMDKHKRRYKVENGDLTVTCLYPTIYNLYSLKQILDLDFKKVYDVDWSKVAVDTKILVSNDGERWVKAHFAMFEDDTLYSFSNGTTSFTYGCSEFVPWLYAKIYKEE